MAAEIARAASTPSGSAAGSAAAKDAQKPAGPGTVLVVPKKKQSSPPLRTPKKPTAAVAVGSAHVRLITIIFTAMGIRPIWQVSAVSDCYCIAQGHRCSRSVSRTGDGLSEDPGGA